MGDPSPCRRPIKAAATASLLGCGIQHRTVAPRMCRTRSCGYLMVDCSGRAGVRIDWPVPGERCAIWQGQAEANLFSPIRAVARTSCLNPAAIPKKRPSDRIHHRRHACGARRCVLSCAHRYVCLCATPGPWSCPCSLSCEIHSMRLLCVLFRCLCPVPCLSPPQAMR